MPQLRVERGVPVAAGEKGLQEGLGGPAAPYGKLKPGPGKSPAAVARNQRMRLQGAMVELLFEQGYDDITVRKLAQRAGVSTRAFYQCYSSKEECFLSVHELTARRLLLEITVPRTNVEDPEVRMRCTIDAFLGELDRDPRAARLVLVDVHTAGPNAQAQARRALRSIEARISNGFGGSVATNPMQQFVAEGIASGLVGTARSHFVYGQGGPLSDLSQELSLWALSYRQAPLLKLEEHDSDLAHQGHPTSPSSRLWRGGQSNNHDDAGIFLAAVTRLAASGDPQALTIRNVLETAGLSRRAFHASFVSLEDSVVAAQEVRVGEAIAVAQLASRGRPTSARRVARAVAVLCGELVQDSALSGLCFGRLATHSPQRLSCQERIREHMSGLIECAIEPSSTDAANRLCSRASVAACWGLIQSAVVVSGTTTATKLAPVLSYLILAPAIGAAQAVDAISEEYDFHKQPGRST